MRTLLLLTLLFASVRSEARGLVVSPAQVGLVGRQSTVASANVTVASSRNEETQVRVTFVDFERTEDAKTLLLPHDRSHSRSCRTWLTTPQIVFTSPAEGKIQVPITAKIPREATGSYWAAAVFTTIPASFAPKAPSVRIVPQIAIPIIVTIEGTEKVGIKILSLVANHGSESVAASAEAENFGNTAVMVGGAFTLEKVAGGEETEEEIANVDVSPTLSLPGRKTRVRGAIRWNGPVDHTQVRAILRYGLGATDVTEATVPLRSAPSESPAAPKSDMRGDDVKTGAGS